MNKNKSIGLNYLYQIGYQVVTIVLPLLVSPYISRRLGPEGIGIYTYSYTIAYYFVLFSMLGISNYGNRTIAQVRDNIEALNREFSAMIFLHFVVSIVCFIIYILYCFVLPDNSLYASIQIPLVLSAMFDIAWFYYGMENVKAIVIRNTIIKCITTVCIFFFVKSKSDLWKYCLIYSISAFVSQVSLWIFLKHSVTIVKVSWSDIKKHIVPVTILFLPAVAVSLYKYMDKAMIGRISSVTQLGYYSNSESLITMVASIPAALGTVMLPKMSNLVSWHKENELKYYINLSFKYTLIMSYALMFGILGITKRFVPFFWGRSFDACIPILVVFAFTIPVVSFANVIRNQYLLPTGRDKTYVESIFWGAAVNLVLNCILIRRFGALGASVATLCAEMIVCFIQAYAVRKFLPLTTFIIDSIPYMFFGLMMSLWLYFGSGIVANDMLYLILGIMTGGVFYILLTGVYLLKTKDILLQKILEFVKRRTI